MAEWHWELVTDDLLDGLPPAALATVRQVTEELTVRESMIFLDGREFTGEPPGLPAVAGPAYFAVAGRTVTFMACALGGYTVLMALVQVRLIPIYRRLSFTPAGTLCSPAGPEMARGFRTSQAIAMTTAVTTAGIPAASKRHLSPAGKVN